MVTFHLEVITEQKHAARAGSDFKMETLPE
jgi:hypothetical protein